MKNSRNMGVVGQLLTLLLIAALATAAPIKVPSGNLAVPSDGIAGFSSLHPNPQV
jgi:hypothetical protein